MATVELNTDTLAVVIAGLYCSYNNINSMAIPESLWLTVAEKVEYFLPNWNYDVITFEDWVKNSLTILPKVMMSEEKLQYLQENTLYTESKNGNAVLVVAMDIRGINAKQK